VLIVAAWPTAALRDEQRYQVRSNVTHWTETAATVLPAPQRNRNELGETTVNKTWRKLLPQQKKSTTENIFTAFGTQETATSNGHDQ
jgi:hypothetical protein